MPFDLSKKNFMEGRVPYFVMKLFWILEVKTTTKQLNTKEGAQSQRNRYFRNFPHVFLLMALQFDMSFSASLDISGRPKNDRPSSPLSRSCNLLQSNMLIYWFFGQIFCYTNRCNSNIVIHFYNLCLKIRKVHRVTSQLSRFKNQLIFG